MLKRVLIYFKEIEDTEYLLKFGKLLNEVYKVDLAGIYLKNIPVPPIIDGEVGIGSEISEIIEQEGIESDHLYREIKIEFLKEFKEGEFYYEHGETNNILEKLKYFDLLVLAKKEMIDSDFKEILKKHNKPILLIPESENYSLDRVLFANDMDLKSNKSFFRFMNIFEKVKEYEIVTVDSESDTELKKYTDKVGKKFIYTDCRGEIVDEILKLLKTNDLLVMGNLKHSLIYEKIAKKTGISLIEKSEKPIFIA